MIDLSYIENYYRARGCTCVSVPAKPGDDHDSTCKMLFVGPGLREWLKRFMLAIRAMKTIIVFGRAGLWRGMGIGLAGRRFARRIRRSSLGGEWLRLYVGASSTLTKFLYSGAWSI